MFNPKDRINCLVYAISPTHIISAICAILTRHAPEDVNVVILVQWPGAASDLSNELSVAIEVMVRKFSFVERVKLIPDEIFSEMLIVNDDASFKLSLKEWIDVDYAEEIYYSHDVVGQLYQGLSTVYDNARRICFGDAMGLVFERHVHLGYLAACIKDTNINKSPYLARKLRTWLGRVLRKVISIYSQQSGAPSHGAPANGLILKDFLPDEAILILPVDQSGNFLKQLPLTVCPKPLVLDVLNRCEDSCGDLQAYIHGLLNEFKGRRKYLLLTENHAEGNFIDFEREIEMYCHIVTDYCETGSLVFLKSHPGETLPRNDRIAQRLAGKYEVLELNKEFKRYPVELWKGIIYESTTICMSYPVLSLKYLYEVDVIQPMTHEFIERWFPQWTWASYKNAENLYMEPLKKLSQWDGKSVLWAGQTQVGLVSA